MAQHASRAEKDAAWVQRWLSSAPGMELASLLTAIDRCILQGIHIVRAATLGSLLAYLGVAARSVLKVPGLPPRTSLLVVDSLSFLLNVHSLPVQATGQQRKTRADALASVLQLLTVLRDFHIPAHDRLTVVVTTQMATRRPGDRRLTTEAAMESVLVPSLTTNTAPAMRASVDSSAYEWGPSILGRSAWRCVLQYHGAGPGRYVLY